MIEEFAKKVDKLYIFEELEPVIEEQIKAWGIECIGKEIFTRQGEYSANLLREKLLGQNVETKPYHEPSGASADFVSGMSAQKYIHRTEQIENSRSR